MQSYSHRGAGWFTILTVLLPAFLSAGSPSADMQKALGRKLIAYAEGTYGLPAHDIQLRVRHWPGIPEKDWEHYTWSVERRSQSADVGYQTLWLVARDGPLIRGEYPVSVDISVTVNSLVTTQVVKRFVPGNKIPHRLQRTRISRNFQQIVRSTAELDNKVTRQVIPAGRKITRDMLIDPPDVLKGDKVKVAVHTGDLVISTDGVTAESGAIGEKIRVYCTATRVYLTGRVKNSNTVIIETD